METASLQPRMTIQEANRLVAQSRDARWSYPSSQGRPVKWDTQEEWVERLVREQGSFKEAARVLIDNGRDDLAVEIAANVWRLWILARDDAGGREFLASVLEKTGKGSRARALALYGDGLFAFRLGEIGESRKRNEEALKIAEQVNDHEAETLSHLGLSRVDFEEGNYQSALFHASKARKLCRGLDRSFGQAPLFMQAQSRRMLGNYNDAASLFRQSVELNRKISDIGMIVAELTNLGFVELHLGNVDSAERSFNESEKLAPKLTDPYSQGMSLLTKGAVAFLKADSVQAQSLLAQSEKVLKESGLKPGPDDGFEIDWLKSKLARP